MEEEIRVDSNALAEEIKKKAKENGLIITAYMSAITPEEFVGGHFYPIVDIEGMMSPITAAFMVNVLENTIEQLKEIEDVDFLAKGLKAFSTSQTIQIKKGAKHND